MRTQRGQRALRLRSSAAAGQRQGAHPLPAASRTLARCVGLGLAAAWIVAVAGCASDPRYGTRPDVAPIALRFIADDPQVLFNDEGLFDEEREFVWKLRFPWDLLWWRLGATDVELQRSGAPAVFTPRGRSPRLERNAQMDTEPVHAIRLLAEGATNDWVLYWTRTAERVSGDRHIRAHPRDTDRKEVKAWDFVVASHPRWKKRLLGMRLDPVVEPKQRFQIHSLSGIRFVVNGERLEQVVNRPWKVDLKRDVRNALLIPPGRSVERDITVPERAELRFAYGFRTGIVPPHTAEPIRFRVAIARAGGEPETLYEGTLDPILTGAAAPRWQERVLDLGPYAGARVRLTLETAANATWQPVHGFPFWANPEVIHRTPRPRPSKAGVSDAGGSANVVLISIDTLRAVHLSLYGYRRETSPHIDAWARRVGVTFENAIVQAPWTLPSHVSMLTGLEALHHQANYSPAPPELTMLAEVLRRAGHTTVAVTGGGYVGPGYGFAQGFDRYECWQGSNAFEMTDGMNRTIKWIEENADRPFFIFFHTYAVHSPFRSREPYASVFAADLPERPLNPVTLQSVDKTATDGFRTRRMLAWPDGSTSDGGTLSSAQQASVLSLYDSGIAFADATLDRLFTRLGELALERDTLVILTSDHGEAFGEHDLVGHGYLTEDNLRVPLVVAFPRRLETARTLSSQVRSIDIVPTVLDLLGLPSLAAIDGVSLVPLMETGATPEASERGRDAWTYAASSNYGVSLRVANRLQYVFNDTPWDPIRGREAFFTLLDGSTTEAMPPEAATLREQMRATLAERPGLRMRFSNAGPRPYSGGLHGAGINAVRVKTFDMACPCARWEGGVRFTVPPGQAYTLLLENVEATPLSLMVHIDTEAGPPERHSLELDAATLTEPLTLAFHNGAWAVAGDAPQPATGVRVWWHGAPNIQGPSQAPPDPQRQQLRALGYIK